MPTTSSAAVTWREMCPISPKKVHARLLAMFDFARGEAEKIPELLGPDALRSSLRMPDLLGDGTLEAQAQFRWDRYACGRLLDGTGDASMIDVLVGRNPEMAMRCFGISSDEDEYLRGGHRYELLRDALACSALEAARASQTGERSRR